jgi:hypothetical protein
MMVSIAIKKKYLGTDSRSTAYILTKFSILNLVESTAVVWSTDIL